MKRALPVLSAAVALSIVGCSAPLATNAGAVTAVEVTDDGSRKAIPATGVTEVDVNSSIELQLDEQKVEAAFAAASAVDSTRLDHLNAQAMHLGLAAEQQKLAWLEIQSLLKHELTSANAREIAIRVGTLEKRATDLAKTLMTRTDWNAQLRTTRTSSELVIEMLARKAQEVQKEVDEMMARQGRMRWRMQASLMRSSGPEFIHLEGYDDLSAGSANLVDKLAIPKGLQETLDEAKSTAEKIRDLQTFRNSVLEQVQQKLGKLAEQLRGIIDIELMAKAELETLASLKQVTDLTKNIKSVVEGLTHTVAACGPVLHDLEKFTFDAARAGQGSTCFDAVQKAATEAKAKETLSTIAAFKERIAKELRNDDSLKKKCLDALSALETGFQTVANVELANLRALFQSGSSFGATPTFVSIEHSTDRTFRELSNAKIDLVRTSRSKGDLIYYRSAVVTDGTEIQSASSAPLRVVVNGVRVDASASVVFVQPLKKGAQDSPFPAAPAANVSLHYRVPRAANANRSGSFWNFLDPGIGIHVAYLDLGRKASDGAARDPGTEIGLGGTMQLFGDVLQAGVAYDLQVERPYYFLGVGLQTLTAFGLSVPAGGT